MKRSQSQVESESREVGSERSNLIEGADRGMGVILGSSITEVSSQDRVIIDLESDKSTSDGNDQSLDTSNYEKELRTNEKTDEYGNIKRSQFFLVSGRATEVMWISQE